MKSRTRLHPAGAAVACALLLAACASDRHPAPSPAARRPARPPAASPPSTPAAASHAAQPGAAPAPGADSGATPAPGSTSGSAPAPLPRVEPAPGPATTEWQRLATYQKSPFQVFSLTETQAGFRPVPGAVGVYSQPVPATAPLRLRLAVRPDSPVRLTSGSYAVQLQLAFDYTERRSCNEASCNGEVMETSRKANKTVRLLLAPEQGHVAEATLPLALLKSGTPDRGYDVSYTGITLKVRRLSFAPARR